jgi:hypothetical protein
MSELRTIQRPRILRDEDGGTDERTATFFADKALRAIVDDLAKDRGLAFLLAGPRVEQGHERFMKFVKKHATGNATLHAGEVSTKREFTMMWDRLTMENDRLTFSRLSVRHAHRHQPYYEAYDLLTLSRHSLIRSVQRIQIRSVEDVLQFLKVVWDGTAVLLTAIKRLKLVTPGEACWLVPIPFGDDEMLGLILGRPTADKPSTLVTVIPDCWLPDDSRPLGQELQRTLYRDSKAVCDPIIVDTLAKLVR